MSEFLRFITSVEGISLCILILAILGGGINELVYFNRLCKSTSNLKGYKGYDELVYLRRLCNKSTSK